jgi:hypothetical protein
MIGALLFLFLGAIAIPMGVGNRSRYRDGYLRSERFARTVTTTLIKAATGLARMRVKLVQGDEDLSSEERRSSYQVTIVEAMIDDRWVQCFSSWEGRLFVEDRGRRRAEIELNHAMLLSDGEESDWTIVQQLPSALLTAASERGLHLRAAPWVYARRFRTRVAEVRVGDMFWILGGVTVSQEPSATGSYRGSASTRAWKIVSRLAESSHPRQELLIIKASDFDKATQLVGLEGQGYFWGSLLLIAGLPLVIVGLILAAACGVRPN